MLKVGDKVMCVKEQEKVYVNLGDVLHVVKKDLECEILDILVECKEGAIYQWACSKNFVKVVD